MTQSDYNSLSRYPPWLQLNYISESYLFCSFPQIINLQNIDYYVGADIYKFISNGRYESISNPYYNLIIAVYPSGNKYGFITNVTDGNPYYPTTKGNTWLGYGYVCLSQFMTLSEYNSLPRYSPWSQTNYISEASFLSCATPTHAPYNPTYSPTPMGNCDIVSCNTTMADYISKDWQFNNTPDFIACNSCPYRSYQEGEWRDNTNAGWTECGLTKSNNCPTFQYI